MCAIRSIIIGKGTPRINGLGTGINFVSDAFQNLTDLNFFSSRMKKPIKRR